MNTKLAITLVSAALTLPAWMPVQAADSGDTGTGASMSSKAKTGVKDSVITTKVKAELAQKKLSSLMKIKVDTDNAGVVTLSGTVPTKADADNAVAIARGVDGVTSVENNLQVAADK